MQALLKYFLDKAKSKTHFHKELSTLLEGKNGDVGIVLSERIVNMPPAVAGPNYKMLLEEIQWAVDDVHPLLLLTIAERALRIQSLVDIVKDVRSRRDRKR